jgi:hypothetical protein
MRKGWVSVVLGLLVVFTAYCVFAAHTKTILISAEVVDVFSVNTTTDVSLAAYTDPNEEATPSADLSLAIASETPVRVEMTAGYEEIFNDLVVDDGFGEQLHVEVDQEGDLSVEICESLGDVPQPTGSQASTPVEESPPAIKTGQDIRVEMKF